MRPGGLLLAGLACIAATSLAAPIQHLTVVAHRGPAKGLITDRPELISKP